MSKDMQRLCEELISQFRNIMLVKTVPENTGIIVCMPTELERIKKTADKLSLKEILSKLEILQSCNERLAKASAKRVELEMCFIKLCNPAFSSENSIKTVDNSDIYAKIEMLENKLKNNTVNSPPAYAAEESNYRQQTSIPELSAKEQPADISKLKLEDFKPVALWAEILERFEKECPPVSGTLYGSKAYENQGVMLVYTENSFFIKLLRVKENAAKLQEAIKAVTGKVYSIRAKCTASDDSGENKVQDILRKAKENNIPTDFQNK
jgi:DNA polymerase-3 subunit gamma/tau